MIQVLTIFFIVDTSLLDFDKLLSENNDNVKVKGR